MFTNKEEAAKALQSLYRRGLSSASEQFFQNFQNVDDDQVEEIEGIARSEFAVEEAAAWFGICPGLVYEILSALEDHRPVAVEKAKPYCEQ